LVLLLEIHNGITQVCICFVPDSGLFCIKGYIEVVMLGRLNEKEKVTACQLAPGLDNGHGHVSNP
jgi:hypothetical protein